MPRPPRGTPEPGLYHLTTRGNRYDPIFVDDRDRSGFLSVLGEVAEHNGWNCHAYCLMSNHYHLLVDIATGNLSSGMRVLNSTYALRFNVDHGYRGHLFGERFHHVKVRDDWHLQQVIRYLALNPVEAGLCARAEDWPWGSFAAVIGRIRPPEFLDVSWTLRLFSRDDAEARRALFRLTAPEAELVLAQAPGTVPGLSPG